MEGGTDASLDGVSDPDGPFVTLAEVIGRPRRSYARAREHVLDFSGG